MARKSKCLEFENALLLRNQIIAMQHLQEHQKMQRQRIFDEDVINYIIKDGTVYLMLFNIYRGTLSTKNEFVFSYNPDFLEEFIVQYYSENPSLTHQIQIKLPSPGTHGQNLPLAPAISGCEHMHLLKHSLRPDIDLVPEE